MAIFHHEFYLKKIKTFHSARSRHIYIHEEPPDIGGKQAKLSRRDKYATNPYTLKAKLFTEKYV